MRHRKEHLSTDDLRSGWRRGKGCTIALTPQDFDDMFVLHAPHPVHFTQKYLSEGERQVQIQIIWTLVAKNIVLVLYDFIGMHTYLSPAQ